MKYLSPLHQKTSHYAAIESEINAVFYRIFIKPMNAIFSNEVTNSRNTALISAIKSGKVTYISGGFVGKFSSQISKSLTDLGATYSTGLRVWVLPALPPHIQSVIADLNYKLNKQVREFTATLNDINLDYVMSKLDFSEQYEKLTAHIDTEFDQSIKSITIPRDTSSSITSMIARDYSDNMKLYIRGFAEQHIKDLRTKVEENVFSGLRASNLEKMIMETRNVTAAKAKFLARQETSLLLSKYSEQRYKDAGITKYRWLTSRDVRTRHDHKILDGNVFDFNYPPVTDVRTGARNNPGCDYNCRCVAQPIIE